MEPLTPEQVADAEIELIKQVPLKHNMCVYDLGSTEDAAKPRPERIMGCVMERYAAFHNLTEIFNSYIEGDMLFYSWGNESKKHLHCKDSTLYKITAANDEGRLEEAWELLKQAIIHRELVNRGERL